mmetsp:Transcript_1110/g.1529  ORF Transcript_1110/g.1529 Transcript_1110/m.1529 type:complete len:219 (+) Transcript_1110:79-735(+)|eukprot:CAMPEP_0195249744 /NCGR_PEP_ID=MMETSP0706-20130129/2292_1 /TAXON_ID=33640 /ORGANISM="Asterionellopsis glacialis, Strain CCMP134" /LENGTH=218 /DNA_ID=CAMNT_0040301593 /DNA_START=74 /DNA_END=730 /DNA_ORIENTATION=+
MRFFLSSSVSALVLSTCIVSIQAKLPEEWPAFRYTEWDALPPEIKSHAKVLSYTEVLWNTPDNTASVEYYDFFDLDEAEKNSALAMGWTGDQWDCYQNHYAHYSWSDLEDYGLDTHYETLGYNEEMFNNDETSVAFDKFYDELDLDEKLAAEQLCYFEENWNLRPLSEYPLEPPPPVEEPSVDSEPGVQIAGVESSALGVTVTTSLLIVSAAVAVIVL